MTPSLVEFDWTNQAVDFKHPCVVCVRHLDLEIELLARLFAYLADAVAEQRLAPTAAAAVVLCALWLNHASNDKRSGTGTARRAYACVFFSPVSPPGRLAIRILLRVRARLILFQDS